MVEPVNVSWSKTKKNVEEIIAKYVYYSLSVDNSSTSNIKENFLLDELDFDNLDNTYVKIEPVDDRYIANNLGFSLGYYYIKKKETLIRFAYCLGVEELSE